MKKRFSRRKKKRSVNTTLVAGSIITLLYILYRINKGKKIEPEQIANIHGYTIKDVNIIGDGSCMFRAIADQINNDQENYQFYRDEAVDYIEQNILSNNILHTNFETTIKVEYPGLDYETYLTQMRQTRWGDSIILQALANTLNRRITVINFEIYLEEGELNPQVQIFVPGFWNSEEIERSIIRRNVRNVRNVRNIFRRNIAIGYINRDHYVSLQRLKE